MYVQYELYESLVISTYCILSVKLEIKRYMQCTICTVTERGRCKSESVYKWING